MTQLYPEFFRRIDEGVDQNFYTQPRFVTHIDEAASTYTQQVYDKLLPQGGRVLDLMSAYRSHLPNKFTEVTGLGLNYQELTANEALTDVVVFDLNLNKTLPFETARFDGAVCTASVQYMTRPSDTFAEVGRCLAPGAPFAIAFSNRMFPTKAILAWRSSDDAAHIRLVKAYFSATKMFSDVHTCRFVPQHGDPMYVVWAYKK
ncbi:MAG: methyltransferase domain-containing protein [Deinococcota bacterium]